MNQDNIITKLLEIPEENETIEFKRVKSSGREVSRILESIVGLANADGGTLVLGIDDPEKSKLKGLDRVFGIEEDIDNYEAIGREVQKIVPPLGDIWPPQRIFIPEIQKTVALLTVPKAINNFCAVGGHVYVRERKSNRLLTPHEISKFAYAKGFSRADRDLVDVDFHLLDTDYFKQWQGARGITGNVSDILDKTGLAKKDETGTLRPTRAAVLLFAEYPNDIMETKCTIRVFQYSGNREEIKETLNLVGVPKTIHGPVIKQIPDAHEYILGLLRNGLRVPSGFVTQYSVPERAIKETITNAVIHRDYHIKRDIEVRVFTDRVEIESPGLLPSNITPSNIGMVRSEGYRNDLLVKHLREFSNPPNLDQNEGIKAMRESMAENGLYPPVFVTYPNIQDGFRVVLLNTVASDEWGKVHAYLTDNKYISNEEARSVTGIARADVMSRLLNDWVKIGLLVQIVPSTGYVRGIVYRLPSVKEI
jgi:ATP-dependent DNA helicase RecG